MRIQVPEGGGFFVEALRDDGRKRLQACRPPVLVGGSRSLQAPECNSQARTGFSRGPFRYASNVRLAPQETRTYFVTAVTAQRRSLFQVTATAELFQQTILDYRGQGGAASGLNLQ
jgi:hypothetical protein